MLLAKQLIHTDKTTQHGIGRVFSKEFLDLPMAVKLHRH